MQPFLNKCAKSGWLEGLDLNTFIERKDIFSFVKAMYSRRSLTTSDQVILLRDLSDGADKDIPLFCPHCQQFSIEGKGQSINFSTSFRFYQ